MQHDTTTRHSSKTTATAPDRLVATIFTAPITVIAILMLLFLYACASEPQSDPAKQKEAWLAVAYGPHKNQSSSSKLTQLPASTEFRQQILKGQVTNRMSLDDAFAALRMQPYGTEPQQAVYWCDSHRVTACSNRCLDCEAMLFGQHNIVFLQGNGRNITVNDSYPKRFEDYRATVDSNALQFAEQIHQRQIVPGMSAGVVQMIINQLNFHTEYFCGTNGQPQTRSCLGRCDLCKVTITNRSGNLGAQTIFLETHANQQTVTNVLTQ